MFPLENQVANFLQSWLGDSMCLDFGVPGRDGRGKVDRLPACAKYEKAAAGR